MHPGNTSAELQGLQIIEIIFWVAACQTIIWVIHICVSQSKSMTRKNPELYKLSPTCSLFETTLVEIYVLESWSCSIFSSSCLGADKWTRACFGTNFLITPRCLGYPTSLFLPKLQGRAQTSEPTWLLLNRQCAPHSLFGQEKHTLLGRLGAHLKNDIYRLTYLSAWAVFLHCSSSQHALLL